MKVGDLVIRNPDAEFTTMRFEHAVRMRDEMGLGIVLSKQFSGKPVHPCVTVYYPKAAKIYDIAESLVEVVSEC